MNFKAWDNKEATYGTTVLAFVGFKGLWEIMDLYLTSGSEGEDIWSFIPHASVLVSAYSHEQGGLHGLQVQE